TTLDVERGEPAVSHVRTALAGGAHVITTNKGPAAFAYRSLMRAADRAGRRFLFEGAVMDGVPIFNLVREALPAVAIVGFRGVVNSTTNYILTAMEQGQPFADALAETQAMGIAEADPSLDVDGWDAAAKTSALANVLLGASMTPRQVERQGISPETGRLAREALAAGQRLKLVVRAGQEGHRLTARVARRAGVACRRRWAGGGRGTAERADPAHGSAGGNGGRAEERHPHADSLRAAVGSRRDRARRYTCARHSAIAAVRASSSNPLTI